MKAKAVKQWVAELRSGLIPQARAELYNKAEGSYCVLGVLCKISGRAYDPSGGVLSDPVAEWAGSCTVSPQVLITQSVLERLDALGIEHCAKLDEDRNIWELNDWGVPFSLLADIIEEQYCDEA